LNLQEYFTSRGENFNKIIGMIFWGEIWHLGNGKKVGVANGVRVISLGKGWVHVTIFRQIVSSISCQKCSKILKLFYVWFALVDSSFVLLDAGPSILFLVFPHFFGCFGFFDDW
jgi:hypothetical protein